MSGFVGADVAQLRALAGSLEQAGSRLAGSASNIDVSVHRSTAWHGPAADRFRTRWASNDRPRLLAASRELQEAARKLRSNADEQERASGAAGSGRASASAGASVFVPRVQSLGSLLPAAARPLQLGANTLLDTLRGRGPVDPWQVLSAVQRTAGRFSDVGETLDAAVRTADGLSQVSGVLHAYRSGALTFSSALHAVGTSAVDALKGGHGAATSLLDRASTAAQRSGQSATLLEGARGVSSGLHVATKIAGGAGTVLSAVSAVQSDAEFITRASHGQVSASEVFDVVGTNLKVAPMGSPLWLGGVASKIVATDIDLARQTDFSSSTFNETMAFIGKNPGALGTGLVDGVKDIAKRIPGWFL